MPNSKIRVAIVGTGFGQKVHIPAFQAHPETEIVAVYHRDLGKAQAIAAQHNIPYACDQVAEAIALADGVSISTPPCLHYPIAKAALQAQKHVFLEKPAALQMAEVQELKDLAARNHLAGNLNFEFRYVPAWMRLKELLQEDYVGRKRLIKVDWLVPGRADSSRAWSWHCSKADGGGALGALGSHTFDYLSWLFGPIKRLWAELSVTIPTRPDPTTGKPKPVDADDTCNLLLKLADGTPCQVNISFSTYQGRGHWLEVYGDRGTLVLGSSHQTDYVHGFELSGSQQGRSLEVLKIPERLEFEQTFADGRIAPTLRVIDRWVEAIRSQQTLSPAFQEGVYSQLLMDLSQESNTRGCWVDVPDVKACL
jgi:predicted dehydrogenase